MYEDLFLEFYSPQESDYEQALEQLKDPLLPWTTLTAEDLQ